ncbi:MAG: TPM domain-containing protein [Firmicutes bacterium]|nr:TPM domain-containing protein [Bacillota bacterium]
MRKRIIIFLTCMIIVSMMGTVHAQEQLVFDYADVFTDAQAEELEQMAREIGEAQGLDILILFVKEGFSESELRRYSNEFYDNGGYGYEGPGSTGVVLAVDIKSRKFYFDTCDGANIYFTESRLDALEDAVVPELSDNDWYEASKEFIRYMKKFRNPYLPVSIGQRAAISASRLPMYILIAAAGSGLVVFIMVKGRGSRVTVNRNTYLHPGSFAMVQQDDIFIREYTTRRRIQRSSSGGGGGGGGGSRSGGGGHGGRSGSF